MAKNVLLVYPGKYGAILPELPLPLLYLSSALEDIGYSPRILDLRLQKYKGVPLDDVLCVGISTMTGPMIKYGLEFAKYVRSVNPELPIIWGGIHPTLLAEQTVKNEYVDIVVRGEGEKTIQELVQALEERRPLDTVDGITYKHKAEIKNNPDRRFLDMNSLKTELPYGLLDLKKYELSYFPIHTSRGCPYRCGFCYNLAFNKRHWRAKTAAAVLDEIEYVIKKFGAHYMSFMWEDEFFINKNRGQDICEGLLRRNLKIKWGAFCRFNHFYKFDREFIQLLEKSGCDSLSFGAESGSQRMLDEVIKKDITIEQIIKTTEKLANTKIRQIVSFMSGLPEETEQDMNKTYQLIGRLCQINPNIYLNGIFLYTPYPGTPLFDLVRTKYNYRVPASLEAWANFGIYRNVGATWQPKSYINKYKTISILTRFPFYRREFRLKDVKAVIGGERFERFPYNIIYYIFTILARWRWQRKYFKFPVEWWILEKVLEKVRGFI